MNLYVTEIPFRNQCRASKVGMQNLAVLSVGLCLFKRDMPLSETHLVRA